MSKKETPDWLEELGGPSTKNEKKLKLLIDFEDADYEYENKDAFEVPELKPKVKQVKKKVIGIKKSSKTEGLF